MREMKLLKTLPQQLADVGAREQFLVKAPKEIPSLSCAEARVTALAHCLARPSQQGEGRYRVKELPCLWLGTEKPRQNRNTTGESKRTKILDPE